MMDDPKRRLVAHTNYVTLGLESVVGLTTVAGSESQGTGIMARVIFVTRFNHVEHDSSHRSQQSQRCRRPDGNVSSVGS
jgi:hypothetical protein